MIFTALLFGLISSFHCIGMCGPIAMMLPLDRQNPARKVIQLLAYHGGRIISYGILGGIFGIFGRGLFLAGIQQRLSIIIGVMMILFVATPFLSAKFATLSTPLNTIVSSIKTSLGKRLRDKSPRSLLTLGILNGFLPCGLVYAALFGALAMQNAYMGVAYMMLFGVGTIPLMAGTSLLVLNVSNALRYRMQTIVPIAVSIIGLVFIARGLGLGIPYLSPADTNLFVQANPQCH